MKRAYGTILRLYPYDFRAAFAPEMLAAFDAGMGNRSLRELAALARGLAAEWLAKLTTDPITRGRSLPDVRMMRPAGITREQWFSGV